ncbi:MAG TPA: hypothetical protein GX515_07245 [Firmicutes bacterium]|nr:hypothetical protein [Bacillota bacterium]
MYAPGYEGCAGKTLGYAEQAWQILRDYARLVAGMKRWWFRQLAVNPGRVDAWIVAVVGILAMLVIVAVLARLIG